MTTLPYYPDRLVRDGKGRCIEQHRASPKMKRAEAKLWRKQLGATHPHARQAEHEADIFDDWAERQRAMNRPESELTFGNCVSELGLLKTAVS